MTIEKLIASAQELTSGRLTNTENCEYGGVAAAILTVKNTVYTGISLDNACGIGFCAEHAAVADMLKHGETEIKMCVAVSKRGKIFPPCGRCRELLYQIDKRNLSAQIVISKQNTVILSELLPLRWQEIKQGDAKRREKVNGLV
jgi:cytidine deaminase